MNAAISVDRETLLVQAQAKLELQRREIDSRCKEWVVSHQRGPMMWLRNLTRTENYQYASQGLDPVMPFPYRPMAGRRLNLKALPFAHDFTEQDPPDYLDVVMGYMMLRDPQLFVAKTREMMTSWLAVGYLAWYCQFFEKTEAVSQSEKDDKAMKLIKYANILYLNQPDWLKKRYPLKRGEEGTQHELAWANGSSFTAMPAGKRQLASSHPTVFFLDEASHVPAGMATINIAKPAVRQIIAVSSVAPGEFADICGCS